MSNIIDWITDIILWLSFGVKELAVVLVSMVPIIELRSGIPVGIKLGLGEWESFLLAFLGSSLVCIPLLLVFRPFFDWAKKWKGIGKFFVRVEEVFRQKAGNMGLLGVFVLAALPIPGTGVWTSSIVAVILGLKFWKAAAVIIGGNLIAGGAMLGLTALFGKHNLDILLFIFVNFSKGLNSSKSFCRSLLNIFTYSFTISMLLCPNNFCNLNTSPSI